MMKRILDKHEWAVDLATAVLCASALAQATTAALDRWPSPAPPAMVIARAEAQARPRDPDRVQKSGDQTYQLEPDTRRRVLDHVDELTRSARIVPEIRDGRPTGFRLYSVQPDGLLGQLGFQNGDLIRTVNGHGLSTPENALASYAALRSAHDFTVTFERNGRTLTNTYHLR